ncbi:hypothetical protein ASPBRDRAFT_37913 [Aspergillus brasiliensis CBS 101740]|uniref:Uncharacterized protein n=1 Tax=Aspergillus brasiliensis (strain CBS 101740 / IMI 381727 / IBT 21946) TaxID=767769 RepID=A0A1L9UVK3_ASPBC|nr:hypothetical protein ASPBRDRAFT_37913 [Aspergillus brasiliensis CBS 101740]
MVSADNPAAAAASAAAAAAAHCTEHVATFFQFSRFDFVDFDFDFDFNFGFSNLGVFLRRHLVDRLAWRCGRHACMATTPANQDFCIFYPSR